jgi:hypothetical protein
MRARAHEKEEEEECSRVTGNRIEPVEKEDREEQLR